MVIFYKKWKKYNEIQLTKNKTYINIRKMTNHPHSPVRESDIHSISPKNPAPPKKQPIDRKKRKGKIVEDYSRDRAT